MTCKILAFPKKTNPRDNLLKQADNLLVKAILINQASFDLLMKATAYRESLKDAPIIS